jgi:ribosomal protein L1
MIKRIHINQHKIRSNKKNNIEEPVITVKTSKSNNYAKEVEILGKSKLVYKPDNPLSCGAKVWIETNEKVVLDNGALTVE